jgi:hypothetical protein
MLLLHKIHFMYRRADVFFLLFHFISFRSVLGLKQKNEILIKAEAEWSYVNELIPFIVLRRFRWSFFLDGASM